MFFPNYFVMNGLGLEATDATTCGDNPFANAQRIQRQDVYYPGAMIRLSNNTATCPYCGRPVLTDKAGRCQGCGA